MQETDRAVEGVQHFNAGRHERAKQIALSILRKNPKQHIALMLMGYYTHAKGRMEEAIDYYKRCLQVRPNLEQALMALAKAYRNTGNHPDALNTYQKIIHSDPKNHQILLEVGQYLYALGDLDKADHFVRSALQIAPNISHAYVLLSRIARDRNDPVHNPVELCKKAIQIDPNNVDAYNSLGVYLLGNGEPEAASRVYADLLSKTGPETAHIFSNWLLSLHYPDKVSREELYNSHKHWLPRHQSEGRRQKGDFSNAPHPDRKLRVGFTSPDFHGHSVFYFLNSLFSCYDRSQYAFICFSDRSQFKEDQFTSILKGYVDEWHHTAGLNHSDYDTIVQNRDIDILIDLTGHTGDNRMLNYMQRCAPVQVTWLGYPDTSGLDSMDYRLVDDITDPKPWADELATETLCRIPQPFLCFKPTENWHSIHSRKETTPEKIVFGSFNMASKISESTVNVWCEILKQIPEAELLIKCRYGKGRPFAMITQMLRELGLSENRLRMLDYVKTKEEHLQTYNQVDVALDPFPYNGTTTSVEAMWMGVPFITKEGDRHCARVGMTLLQSVGLDDFIAHSDEEYLQKAVAIAKDRKKLAEIKGTLRQKMLNSPLCDSEGFARKFETALRNMWKQWCQEQGTQ